MTQRPKKSNPQVIIIGGGASGLAAACICAKQGQPFALLEKENKLGRKLLATGNGRCNLMNTGMPVFFGDSAFAGLVLKNCGIKEVSGFFESLGLVLRQEEGGRVYPATQQAASVLDCLTKPLENNPSATLTTGTEVASIRSARDGYHVTAKDGQVYSAPQVILATGSPAAPKLGGSDSLMDSMRRLGHKALSFDPVLCPLVCNSKPIRGLSGLRLPVNLVLYHGDTPVDAAAGEALFTDYGISGVCAMQLARAAREGLQKKLPVSLSLDFSPLCGLAPLRMQRLSPDELLPKEKAWQDMLLLLQERLKNLGEDALYTGLLPRLLAGRLKCLPMPEAARLLTDFRLIVQDTKGFDQAQAARGGLVCRQFDPATLESRLRPGLFAVGEALNVDGDTGGYNLMFAWATGILAGRKAAAFTI